MLEPRFCGAVRSNGRDCNDLVPPDAPVNMCLKHMQRAYLYILDKIADFEPEAVTIDPRRFPEPTVVYYMRLGNRVKIGTTSDIRNRKIIHDRLLALEPGDRTIEAARLAKFAKYHAAGREWFRDCEAIRNHTAELRRRYGDPETDLSGCLREITKWWRTKGGTRQDPAARIAG